MPPTFTLVEDGERFRPEITEEIGGYRGVRHGWIDTADITDALLNATGAPRRGDSWDASSPNLIVQRRSVTIWSGEVSLMRVEYATPGLGDGMLEYPAALGKPITIAVPSVSSATAIAFVDDNGVKLPGPPIAQGQGASRDIGLMDERVKVAYALSNLAAVPFARIRNLHTNNPRNRDAVTLPNYFGSGFAKPAAVDTLRYRTVEYELQADLFVVTHVLASADDHLVRYEEVDEDGNPNGTEISGHIYPSMNYAGLW